MNLYQYVGQTLRGEELTKILNGMPLIKFMNDDDKHYGMQYERGYNKDILEFNHNGKCLPGGIYVTTVDNYEKYCYKYGLYARRVSLGLDTMIYVEKDKLKCNEVWLGPKILWQDLVKELITEYVNINESSFYCFINDYIVSKLLKDDSIDSSDDPHSFHDCVCDHILELVKSKFKMNDIFLLLVNNDGSNIRFIEQKSRTSELMLAAMRQNGCAIVHIKQEFRTPEIMQAAVKENGYALQFIAQEFRTHEIMLEAVKRHGPSIKYIEEKFRTPEIIFESLRKNGD